MEWLQANWPILVGILGFVLAALYSIGKSNGNAAAILAEIAALLGSWSKEVLAGIPPEDFDLWAGMIYDALPSLAKLVLSKDTIKNALVKARDALVGQLGAARLLTSEVRTGLTSQVYNRLHK